jgi:hypothetical protein
VTNAFTAVAPSARPGATGVGRGWSPLLTVSTVLSPPTSVPVEASKFLSVAQAALAEHTVPSAGSTSWRATCVLAQVPAVGLMLYGHHPDLIFSSCSRPHSYAASPARHPIGTESL